MGPTLITVAIFFYIFVTGLVVGILAFGWWIERGIYPEHTAEAIARHDHKFAVNLLRSPLWPWTLLVLVHRGAKWVALTATRRPD